MRINTCSRLFRDFIYCVFYLGTKTKINIEMTIKILILTIFIITAFLVEEKRRLLSRRIYISATCTDSLGAMSANEASRSYYYYYCYDPTGI